MACPYGGAHRAPSVRARHGVPNRRSRCASSHGQPELAQVVARHGVPLRLLRLLAYNAVLAILLGNLLYFASMPFLPPGARLNLDTSSALPALIDIWYCVLAYGVLGLFMPRNGRPNSESTIRKGPGPRL